jgi:hypothetical protein
MRLDRFRSERPNNAPLSFNLNEVFHLELSIHEIYRYRVNGPALWTYCGNSQKPDFDDLKPLRSPSDLGITFDEDCIHQMKLLALQLDNVRYSHLMTDKGELLRLLSVMHPGLS